MFLFLFFCHFKGIDYLHNDFDNNYLEIEIFIKFVLQTYLFDFQVVFFLIIFLHILWFIQSVQIVELLTILYNLLLLLILVQNKPVI